MLKEAVYHRPKGNFAYTINENTLQIRLRTKIDDVQNVNLLWGDPFTWAQQADETWQWKVETRVEMVKLNSTSLFDYWEAEIQPQYKRVKYGFELQNNNETMIYTEKGFFPEKTESTTFNSSFFTFPFLNEEDVFRAPEWVKDTIWYQIFPERFANGDRSNDIEGTLEWGSQDPSPKNFFGGDLAGIIEKIDHLVRLGINGIYLTPIFKAESNHKYDTIDYMEIDPQFGDKETFKRFVKVCHENGIKVMLDAVFNHCGYYFPQFQDVLQKGEDSKYKDWFYLNEFPVKTEPKANYHTFGFTHTMPKLNTSNPEVREYLLEVGRYWVREFDIDGWRLDVANEVSHGFWREFRKEVKAIKPDCYILGEIWHDAMPWLQGDQFDAVMNYPYTNAAIQLFAENKIGQAEFLDQTAEALIRYPQNASEVAFNLLGSHDTPRIATVCGENTQKVKQLFAFLLSSIGTPCIYYGDEIGMTGAMDPGCRKCMVWEKTDQDLDLLEYITKLNHLRRNNPAFGNKGKIQFFAENSDCVVYSKTFEEETLLFFFNPKESSTSAPVPTSLSGKTFTNVLTTKEIVVDKPGITLPEHGVVILSVKG